MVLVAQLHARGRPVNREHGGAVVGVSLARGRLRGAHHDLGGHAAGGEQRAQLGARHDAAAPRRAAAGGRLAVGGGRRRVNTAHRALPVGLLVAAGAPALRGVVASGGRKGVNGCVRQRIRHGAGAREMGWRPPATPVEGRVGAGDGRLGKECLVGGDLRARPGPRGGAKGAFEASQGFFMAYLRATRPRGGRVAA